MTDKFRDRSSGLESPGRSAVEVTPNDLVDLAVTSRALYVGVEGDLTVTTAGGQLVTFVDVPKGILPMRIARVHQTGTSASGIVAIW